MHRALAGLAAVAVTVVVALSARAAEQAGVDQQIPMASALTEAQRQATMARNLSLGEKESSAFWPLYEDYRKAVEKLDAERVAIVKDFAEDFRSLSDAKANALIKRTLGNQEARDALKAKYIGKLQKVLPAVLVARVLQIENKLDALGEAGLARSIPLVSPPSS